MSSPLSNIYLRAGNNTDHRADTVNHPDSQSFKGVVVHGSGRGVSSTTLVKKFTTIDEASAHAAHFAEALKGVPATDAAARAKAFADEVQAVIDHHRSHL